MLVTEAQFANVVDMAQQRAALRPQAVAVLAPQRRHGRYDYRRWTFAELQDDVQLLAQGLHHLGISAGKRIVLMVPHSYEFIALTFAILRTGGTLVLIDPGMGRRSVLSCLRTVHPDGFVAIPLVHHLRWLAGGVVRRAALNVSVGRGWWSPIPSLHDVRQLGPGTRLSPSPAADADAAIIFTSGSTGPAKGVLFSHANFVAQCEQIRDRYAIEPGGLDVAAFPLFALFNAAMGVGTVIPDLDAARPASVDPRRFIQHLRDLCPTQSFASPAIWNAVGRYCHDQGIQLPGLQRVLMAGAPVPTRTLRWMTECLAQDAQVHTPYGATEALPVASISALQRLAAGTQVSATMGGVCVGRRFAGIDWAVIEIRDAPIASLDDVARCEVGQIGELIVRGPQVTRTYVTSAEANALHKIHDGESVWHRMGDVGYLDDLDQFWFCGRKSQRVVTPAGPLYSVPVESVFDEHPQIYRSALVGLGRAPHQVPIVICEPWRENWSTGAAARRRLRDELGDLARANPRTAGINRDQVLLKASLPVDTRHNSKIFRERLVPWAEKQFRRAKRDG